MTEAQHSKVSLQTPDAMTERPACLPNCCPETDSASLLEISPEVLPEPPRPVLRRMFRSPALLAIGAVKLYQFLISPWLGPRCRFYPSCSQYFILSVQKFGLIRGLCKGSARICRCHPWNPGGYDPP